MTRWSGAKNHESTWKHERCQTIPDVPFIDMQGAREAKRNSWLQCIIMPEQSHISTVTGAGLIIPQSAQFACVLYTLFNPLLSRWVYLTMARPCYSNLSWLPLRNLAFSCTIYGLATNVSFVSYVGLLSKQPGYLYTPWICSGINSVTDRMEYL